MKLPDEQWYRPLLGVSRARVASVYSWLLLLKSTFNVKLLVSGREAVTLPLLLWYMAHHE